MEEENINENEKPSKMSRSRKMMLVVIVVVIMAFLGVYGFMKSVPQKVNQDVSAPTIEALEAHFDFGAVKYGDILKHTFELKNTGSEDLTITKIATSCGCTTAEAEKDIILPEETISLDVTYKTAKMTGAHAKGEQDRIIYIRTNDPVNPQIEIKINAYVN